MSEEIAASIGDVLAENARLRKENMQLRHDVVAWRLIVSRQERALECAHGLIRALNIDLLGLLARESQLHRAARRLLAAWRTERQRRRTLADALYAAIGMAVREARQDRQMTQEQVAKAVGLARTSIVNIEAGRQRLTIDTLYDIADALKIQAVSLLPRNEDV